MLFSCRGGKYTEDDAKAVMIQILNVVAFCHLQGVVHRDLKPEVIFSVFAIYMYGLLESSCATSIESLIGSGLMFSWEVSCFSMSM